MDEALMRDDVMQYCPDCKMIVLCTRTVYRGSTDYTCKQRKHHFSHKNVNGESIPGERPKRGDRPEKWDRDER